MQGGINILLAKDWASSYRGNFTEKPNSLEANLAMNQAVHDMFTGARCWRLLESGPGFGMMHTMVVAVMGVGGRNADRHWCRPVSKCPHPSLLQGPPSVSDVWQASAFRRSTENVLLP